MECNICTVFFINCFGQKIILSDTIILTNLTQQKNLVPLKANRQLYTASKILHNHWSQRPQQTTMNVVEVLGLNITFLSHLHDCQSAPYSFLERFEHLVVQDCSYYSMLLSCCILLIFLNLLFAFQILPVY